MSLPQMDPIERAFVRVDGEEVHLRRISGVGADAAGKRPLVMIHASPGSSRSLAALMRAFHSVDPSRTLIAPDTPGNGDSFAPAPENPDIPWYAASLRDLLDVLQIERADLYGAHTGARTACEAAAAYPERFASVTFDGIGDYSPEMRELLVREYAPEMEPDDYGRHFIWAFNFVRDQALHFPHFQRDPDHRLMTRAVPSAEELHAATLEVLKGLKSYHKAYRAAFSYQSSERMGAIKIPAMLLSAQNELPSLRAATHALAERLIDGRIVPTGPTLEAKSQAILAFLSQVDSGAN